MQDIRFGARSLSRTPAFTVVAGLTLAVGIGASTAIFGVVDGILLRPLPYSDAARAITLWQVGPSQEREALAPANFVDVRERARSFSALAAAEPYTLTYQTPDGPESVRTWLVTEGFFDLLRAPPQLGRTFRPEEFSPGRSSVAIVSDGTWRRRFGADPGIVGRAVTLDGEPYQIVGVMPPAFEFPGGRELWVPKSITPAERTRRSSGYWLVVGRLAAGATLAGAQAEVAGIARSISAEQGKPDRSLGLTLVPLREQLLGTKRPALLLLLGAAGLLLLIACANVANLVLARTLARGRELGVRAALGAGRGRIVRLLAAEAAVLALVGGTLGVALAWSAVRAVRALSPADLPRANEIGLDGRVLGFALVVSILSAITCALIPALGATRCLAPRLTGGGRSVTLGVSGRRTRGGLIVVEIALSLVLLVGAGLLVRSFLALARAERGFRTEHVLAVTVQAWQWYPTSAARVAFVRQAVDRIAALPRVLAAGATSSLPLAEGIGQDEATYRVPDEVLRRADEALTAHVTVATPGYFDAIGLALRRGRAFMGHDDARGTPVVLVNEALVRRHFSGRDPIGQQIIVGLGRVSSEGAREIVGVVGDVRQSGLAADPKPAIFLPHAQAPTGALTFTVHTAEDPTRLLAPVKAELRAMNPAMPISTATTLEAVVADALRERRFHLALLGAFAAVALLLAGVGVYGVLGHAVRERRREFGVRLAVGATAADVLALVLLQGTRLAIIGAVVGLLLAVAGSRLLGAMLYGVAPLDPLTFGAVTLIVLGVVGLATFVPGRRAAALDPLVALRED
jgi:predicted permease